MHAVDANTGEDLWVFGYGSLMWRPGFDFIERVPARLIGLHRALCVYSFVHRGTPERPGLVLGLDRGGMCRGIAFRVAAAARAATVAYLRSREQVTTVYLETVRRIELEERAKRQVRALCFIVDRSHVQYAGRLTLDECLHHVRQGHGSSGANRDYVVETARALEALGYRETDLHRITERLGGAGLAKRYYTGRLSSSGYLIVRLRRRAARLLPPTRPADVQEMRACRDRVRSGQGLRPTLFRDNGGACGVARTIRN